MTIAIKKSLGWLKRKNHLPTWHNRIDGKDFTILKENWSKDFYKKLKKEKEKNII